MPVSDSFREFVMEQLEEVGPVQSRKMFGAVGIYMGDLFFALISRNTLYLKVDDSNLEDFTAYGMKPFKPDKNRKTVMQYYEVPADILEDRVMLTEWARNAVEVAMRARKKG